MDHFNKFPQKNMSTKTPIKTRKGKNRKRKRNSTKAQKVPKKPLIFIVIFFFLIFLGMP
jgi:hypothetical protein